MGHTMRRSRQQLLEEECHDILAEGTEGVLSLVDPNGLPYGIPLNYVLDGSAIYFHCAKAGRKLECIAHNPNASFCVIEANDIVPEKFTTYFRDVIVSGRIRVVENEDDRIDALRKLGLKYNGDLEACDEEIIKAASRCLVLALDIEDVCGKEARELAAARNLGD